MRLALLGVGTVVVLVLLVAYAGGFDAGALDREPAHVAQEAADAEGSLGTSDDGAHDPDAILQGRAEAPAPRGAAPVRRSTVSGRVVHAATGAGIGGAEVTAFVVRGGSSGLTTTSDADGRFEIHDVVPGPWWLYVHHPRYVSPGLDERLRATDDDENPLPPARIDVPDDGRAAPFRVLALTPGRRLEGRVVDDAGRPVRDARLRVEDGAWADLLNERVGMDPWTWRERVSLTTDGEGRFVLSCLPPAFPAIRLAAVADALVGRWSAPIALDADLPAADLTLTMAPVGGLEGRVLEPDRKPARSAQVGIGWDCAEAWEHDWAWEPPDALEVGAHGAWALFGLPPGRVALRADRVEPWLPGAPVPLAPLRPGELRLDVDLVLAGVHVLRGRLVDASGAGLAFERLRVQQQEGEAHRDTQDDEPSFQEPVRTDAGGRFALSTTTPGPLEIVHLAPSRPPRVLAAGLVLPVEPVTLVSEATPRTELTVRVRGPDGRLLERFGSTVSPVPLEDSWIDATSFENERLGQEGVARHEVLGRGPFQVRVRPARYGTGARPDLGTAEVRLDSPPADGVIDVTLRPRDEISGRIVGSEGRPVPGVRLTLCQRDVPEARTLATVPVELDGTWSMRLDDGYPVWGLELKVEVPPGWVDVSDRILRPGTPMDTIVLERAGSLAGRVVAPHGLPPDPEGEPWRVWISWEDPAERYGWGTHALLDEEGRWRSDHVPVDRDLRVGMDAWVATRAGYLEPEHVDGVRAGDPEVVVRLHPADAISGTVLDAAGNAPGAADLLVRAYTSDQEGRIYGPGRVDGTTGHFMVTGLLPGTYTLAVHDVASGVDYDGRVARTGAGDVVLRLPPRGTLRVRVGGPDADALGRMQVWVAGSTRVRADAWTRSPSIDVHGLPADEVWVVVATGVGHAAAVGGAYAGDTVVLQLAEGLPLAGTLRRRRGDGVPFLGRLCALSPSACFDLELGEDDGDFYASPVVLPGRYELRYVAPDGTETVVAEGVEAGREDLELWLP